jgi:hypothetical protein
LKKAKKKKAQQLQIIGRREFIDLPDFNVTNIEAKVDTGAYRTVIHCLSCREIVEGTTTLLEATFDLDGKGAQSFTFENYTLKEVRSSFGQSETRFCIRTKLKLGRREIRSEVTLTDRSEMRYQVLLGRKTLIHKFLVDVSQKFVLEKND